MRRPKYFTNVPLWILFSFLLFIPGWFIPIFPQKSGGHATAITVFSELINRPAPNSKSNLFLVMLVILFAVPAISLGWVLQCLITWFLARRRIKRAH
jgi:hypothetical protein